MMMMMSSITTDPIDRLTFAIYKPISRSIHIQAINREARSTIPSSAHQEEGSSFSGGVERRDDSRENGMGASIDEHKPFMPAYYGLGGNQARYRSRSNPSLRVWLWQRWPVLLASALCGLVGVRWLTSRGKANSAGDARLSSQVASKIKKYVPIDVYYSMRVAHLLGKQLGFVWSVC